MSDIREAKEKLPLPALLHRLGLGQHAKKTAFCPFHDDRHASFSVYRGNKGELCWKCHAGCGGGDQITFLEKHFGISNKEAVKRFLELAGVNGRTPLARQPEKPNAFEWGACVEAFTDQHLEQLADWRGFSGEFCSWLKQKELVGLYEGCIAFPVHKGGHIVGCHVRPKNSDKWFHFPNGTNAAPLIFGEIQQGDTLHCFESTWDGLAFMDVSGERTDVVITRGSANAKFVIETAAKASTLYLWTQNDEPGASWEKAIVERTQCTVKRVKIPQPHKDLNDWTRSGASCKDLLDAMVNAQIVREPERPLIEFRSPLQLKNFVPPPGLVLVGDNHIVKGSVIVEGGPPGVGKSRGAVALAVAGATDDDWFGLTVHRKFKTMIVQTENGEFRLSKEFGGLDCDALENFVRVCPPPPYGLCFGRNGFREQLAAAIAEFAPDVVVFDPWNATAREQDSREYLDTFDALKSVLPLGYAAPALFIVAHTRKPKADERASGRALLNLLAGSYVLGSVPRTVFVMQHASDDTTENSGCVDLL